MDHLCSSHSVLSATDQPLHPLLTASNASLLSQSISPSERGFPQVRESLLCFRSPTPGHRFCPTSSHPTQLCRDLCSPFWCPRSSVSVQLVFCENCCIYRCIPDASVERDELHIFLLLHHLYSPPLYWIFKDTYFLFHMCKDCSIIK